MKNILCVASHLKGFHFMREARAMGCNVHLLTHEKLMDKPWPREVLSNVYAMPNFDDPVMVRNVVGYLSRQTRFDSLVPMGDYDVEVTAALREHLRIPGMGVTLSSHFRDKLAMREVAHRAGVAVPPFTGLFNDAEVNDYLAAHPAPWVLKPRAEASSKGIQVFHDAAALWRALDELGDARAQHLLEGFVDGDLYHVDGVVHAGKVVFASAQRYGIPLLALRQSGGVYSTSTIPRDTAEHHELVAFNARVIEALGQPQGVFHVEYLKDRATGRFYFIEAAARVGAAKICDVVFYATGVCVWHEWAKLEAATPDKPYVPPTPKDEHAGVLLSVSSQEWADTSAYDAPEIVWRQGTRPHHAGLLVTSPDHGRIQTLMADYVPRFARDFAPAAV